MIFHKGERCITRSPYNGERFYSFRTGPVPFTGLRIHGCLWGRCTMSTCSAHKTDALNCDEDHKPFVRHYQKTKNWIRSDSRTRTWKNRKLRHQWEVHLK